MHTQQFRKLFIKSDWIPPLGPPWIEIPLSAIRLELCSLLHSHNRHKNVSSNIHIIAGHMVVVFEQACWEAMSPLDCTNSEIPHV